MALLAEKGIVSLDQRKLCSPKSLDFIKSHILSPDGNILLAASESNFLTSWSLNPEVTRSHQYYNPIVGADRTELNYLNLNRVFNIGESVYDLSWYPFMSEASPESCCFLTTSRDHPIHLWDLNTGIIRCSYIGHNSMDELDPAICVTFNVTGDKIFSGSNRMIRSFDASCPGKHYTSYPTCKTRKDCYGQKGIISCLAFNPDQSGVFAAGSYGMSVCLYRETDSKPTTHFETPFGVTCIRWSPCGNYLWAGGRKHSSVVCYDLRSGGQELGRVERHLSSNQRLSFSLDPWGKYLATGTEDGSLKLFDTGTFQESLSFRVASSCLNSVSFHPYSALILGTSGNRVFPIEAEEDSEQGWSEIVTVALHYNQQTA